MCSGGTWRPGRDFRDLLAHTIHWLSSHACRSCCGYVSGGHVYNSDKEALWWVSYLLTMKSLPTIYYSLMYLRCHDCDMRIGSHILVYLYFSWVFSPISSRLILSVGLVWVFCDSLSPDELGSIPLYGDACVGRMSLVLLLSHSSLECLLDTHYLEVFCAGNTAFSSAFVPPTVIIPVKLPNGVFDAGICLKTMKKSLSSSFLRTETYTLGCLHL